MQITDKALHVLHHTLGVRPDRREPFRNHFVAGAGHHDMPALEELERAGMMERRRTPAFCDPDDVVFAATDTGRRLALELLPQEPKRTKYEEFLHADCCDSFADFLGIWRPNYEACFAGKRWEYRMYRTGGYGGWRIARRPDFVSRNRRSPRQRLQDGDLIMGANTEVKDWTKVGWIPVGDSAEMARREAIRQELQARVNACPFCGHEPRLHMKNRPGERPAITCQCGASMAFDGKTEFYLIEQWNRRAKQCA